MSLNFAALVPHSPILIPAIGKENTNYLQTTLDAYKKIEADLYVKQIETVVFFSPHGIVHGDSYTINLSPKFEIKFEEFGDFVNKLELDGDLVLAQVFKSAAETSWPLQMASEKKLDHGTSIPAFLLLSKIKAKIIPIYYSELTLQDHFNFGKFLGQQIRKDKKRIAVIASGDMSHRLDKKSPAGYSPKGAKFDKKIKDCLKDKKIQEILEISPKNSTEVAECGLRSLVTLLGVLDGQNYSPQPLSYESPFGIGYLTFNFNLDEIS